MKILVVNKGYKPWIGGVETAVKTYCEAFKQLKINVEVLCCHQTPMIDSSTSKVDGITVHRMKTNFFISSAPISISFFDFLIKRNKNYDLIHFNEPFQISLLGYFFITKKTPFIISHHSDIQKQKIAKYVLNPIINWMYKKSKIITIGNPTFLYNSKIIMNNKKKVEVIPYTDKIESGFIHNIVPDLKFKLKKNYFLMFSRYSYYKGFELLQKTLPLLEKEPDLHFLVVASGLMPEGLNSFFSKHPKVTLINREISEEEKRHFFKGCRAYLFPSTHISESFGITQLEALKNGAPVINSLLPTGVPWVSIDEITGFSFKVNDKIDFADKILKMHKLSESDYNNLINNCVNRYISTFSSNAFKTRIKQKIISNL